MGAPNVVPTYLHDGTTSVLKRLGDQANEIWSRSEIDLYLKDGYDQFCGDTKCLFDRHVIPNLPPVGNWQSDLERYLMGKQVGFGITDEPFYHTAMYEKNISIDGVRYGDYRGPRGGVNLTSPSERSQATRTDLRVSGNVIPTLVRGGDLPQSTVEVHRVAYNQRTLPGQSSQRMREMDATYEDRSGEPQWFIWDKDGIFFLRVVPAATANATYESTDGTGWGIVVQRQDSDSTVIDTIVSADPNAWGRMTWRTDSFPSGGGEWGHPSRIHPDEDNIVVEMARLGRSLDSHPFEVPKAYLKYIYFWAMGQALERQGEGQDLELSKHYYERYEMGVDRMKKKRDKMDSERVGAFGPAQEFDFELGQVTLPAPYENPQWE